MEELIAKFLAGDASDEEAREVAAWRDSNPEAFMDHKELWALTKPRDHSLALDQITSSDTRQRVFAPFAKYAAAAAILLGVLVGVLLNDEPNTSLSSQVTLDDGSLIVMHTGASYEVLDFTNSKREVEVNGRVYFDVARDESRPFIIQAGDATVRVLGTSFMINNHGSDAEVCVESGTVELVKTMGQNNISIKLGPGEMGMVKTGNKGILKMSIDDPNYLAWKTKELVFEATEIAAVKTLIEDVYGMEVRIENQVFMSCKLTARFKQKKPKDIAEVISRTFGVTYTLENNVLTFYGRGC